MKLYPILVEARKLWDANDFSEYICDNLQIAMDHRREEQGLPPLLDHPEIEPLLEFIDDELKGEFSVRTMLFTPLQRLRGLTPQQELQLRTYREGLWQRLFDFATEQDTQS